MDVKRIFAFFFLLALLAIGVGATDPLASDLWYIYTFDNSTTSFVPEYFTNSAQTQINLTNTTASENGTAIVPGKINNALNCTRNHNGAGTLTGAFVPPDGQDWCMSAWVSYKDEIGSNAYFLWSMGAAVANNEFSPFLLGTDNDELYIDYNGGSHDTNVVIGAESFTLVTFSYYDGNTSHEIYINDTLRSTDVVNLQLQQTSYQFCERRTGVDNGDILLDDYRVYNTTCGKEQVEYLYNDGDGVDITGGTAPAPGPQQELDVNITSPIPNGTITNQNPINITFVYSTPNGTDPVCRLLNGSSTDPNLIGYWDFEEGNGTVAGDSSPSSQDGVIKNGALFVGSKGTNGTGTFALDLDGSDDFVNISDSVNTYTFGDGASDSAFSFGMWVNMDDATVFRLGGKRADGTETEWFFTIDSSDLARFQVLDASTGGSLQRTSAAQTSRENLWTHYVVTYDGSGVHTGMKIYRNGVAIDNSGALNGAYTAMEDRVTHLELGSINSGTAVADGTIDEAFVFDKVLSVGEINTIYNSGIVIDEGILAESVFTGGIGNFSYPSGSNSVGTGDPEIKCFSNEAGNNSAVDSVSVAWDTIDPIIDFILPLNNTILQSDVQPLRVNGSCIDDNIDFFNYSAYNASQTIFSAVNITDAASFAYVVNITSFADGTYTSEWYCRDEGGNQDQVTHSITFTSVPIPVVTLGAPSSGSTLTDPIVDFDFSVDIQSNCTLFINKTPNATFLNIVGSQEHNDIGLLNLTTYSWEVDCVKSGFAGNSSVNTFFINTSLDETEPLTSDDLLSVGGCPDTQVKVLVLALIVLILGFLIWIGLAGRVPIVGFVGSFGLMTVSWYINNCAELLAFIIACAGLVLVALFIGIGLDKLKVN